MVKARFITGLILFALMSLFGRDEVFSATKKKVNPKAAPVNRSDPAMRLETTHQTPESQATQGSRETPTRPVRPHDPRRPEDLVTTPPTGFPQ